MIRRALPIVGTLISWTIFCVGAAAEYQRHGAAIQSVGLLLAAGLPWLIANQIFNRRRRWKPRLEAQMQRHAASIDALPDRFIPFWIALAAGTGLFLELVVIRFHGCCFQLFAFFKNFSLLSCFLGLGVGYARGGRSTVYTPLVLPMLAVQGILLHTLRFSGIAQVLHNPISEHLALGLEQSQDVFDAATAAGFLLFIFCFNALTFIPLGQIAARLMQRSAKLPSYSWNLIGSLAGIGLFYGLSLLWAPPAVWFGCVLLAMLPLVRSHLNLSVGSGIVLICVLAMSFRVGQHDIYSPYQILSLQFTDKPYATINVNHVYYQRILKLDDPATVAKSEELTGAANHYNLPYLLHPGPQRVMVVGAGTGNDVAAAVRNGAKQIDAVEIDPAILKLGRLMHPEHPYQNPNVHAIVNDARAQLRQTTETYDLIVYGLLDSHTLLSSVSGVRLDSYIYTVEAFRDARARLRPGGMICLSFAMIRGEIGRKLYLMLTNAFDGQPPLVIGSGYDGGVAFIIGDHMDRAAMLARVPRGMHDDTAILAGSDFVADQSTDDWPFFYMPVRAYPVSYAVIVGALLILAVFFVRGLMPDVIGSGGFSWPCFFLGAGFMLLETKAITELALFYGSTWVVVGVVITAILLMAFAANLLMMRVPCANTFLVYGLLLASILARLFIHPPHSSERLIVTGLLTLPLFFAGLAFSSELLKTASIGTALGANLLGAMLGGCLEYNSMYLGYRSLYFLAAGLYALAMITSMYRRTPPVKAGRGNESLVINAT